MANVSLLAVIFLVLGVIAVQAQDNENPIKHLIILMMENRSFDHYLGWLKERNSEIDGLNGDETNCVKPGDSSSTCVTVTKNGYDVGPDDPGHGFDDTAEEIYGYDTVEAKELPKQNGFVYNAYLKHHNLSNPMAMFTIDNSSAPILNTLALEYGLFDKWFCSVPSSTDPNRGFAMSGTSNGMTTNWNGTLWSQQSYFDFLTKHNVSWTTYYDQDPWAVAYFADMQYPPNSYNMFEMDQFYKDLNGDDLSSFVWLQPSLATHPDSGPPNWQHPDASVAWGEVLIQNIYESLRDSKYWNESALLITFDEHGGFYDHVAPPQSGIPPPDGVVAPNGFKFDRLGVRIPTVLISPWIDATVIHEPTNGPETTSQWEASSNLATANNLFGITDHISNREKWAATYDDMFTKRKTPRTDAPIFNPPKQWTQQDVAEQAVKPLNEHIENQVKFYCEMLDIKQCPEFNNQGEASEFIIKMVPRYMEKIQQPRNIQ